MDGAVGRPGAVVSAVKVGGGGGSVLGKYPPPTDVADPLRDVLGCDIGETSLWLCDGCGYRDGAELRFG